MSPAHHDREREMAKERSTRSETVQMGTAIFLGYVSIAIAFGVSGRALGFTLPQLAAMSVFVFAGASQFLAVQLLAAGAGGIGIVLATLILNSRHIVMSLALRDRIDGNRVPRPVLAWGVTDEVFAAAAGRSGNIVDTSLLAIELMAYTGWVSGTIAGYLAGGIIPESVEPALSVTVYALFISLLVPGVARFWRYGIVALAAGGLNWILGLAGVPRGVALLAAISATSVGFGLLPGWSEE
jgi:4-azaleucine resistance transporter AzlC